MKIRNKLFLSFISVAGLSALLATFAAIHSISQRYQEMATKEIIASRQNTESYLYDYMGEMIRKAGMISGLEDIVNHLEQIDELQNSLNSKADFFQNSNVHIISPDKKIMCSLLNAPEQFLQQDTLLTLPFFGSNYSQLDRGNGIFQIRGNITMQIVTPIVSQEAFDFKGYFLVEMSLNNEFAALLKERTRGDIVITSTAQPLATTFIDAEGKRFFPPFSRPKTQQPREMTILNQTYLVDYFTIKDYYGQNTGDVFVAVNINDIIISRWHAIRNVLMVFAIVVLVVILGSFFAGRRFTRPILTLSNGAETVALGNFNLNITPTSTDEIGQLTRLFNKMTDSLKNQTEEIMGLKLFFETVINNSPSAIIIYNVASHTVTVNPAAEKLFAISRQDLQGKELFEIIKLPEELQSDFYHVVLTGESVLYDSYHVTLPDKEEKIFYITFYPVALRDNVSITIQVEDLTESFELEEQLLHVQKMGALGESLARFTHEFNNLMTGILGNIAMLKATTDKDTKNYSRIAAIEELSEQARAIGKNILGFSKKDKFEIERFEINHQIDSILNLVEKTVCKGILFVRKDMTESCYIMGNKGQIQLVILNLLINAKDALVESKKENPTITVALERIQAIPPEKNTILIKITDNGTGIDEKILPRIFEPYFTTKGNKGTGLGLATVKEIVEKCQGTITVESVMQQYTTFSIAFTEAE